MLGFTPDTVTHGTTSAYVCTTTVGGHILGKAITTFTHVGGTGGPPPTTGGVTKVNEENEEDGIIYEASVTVAKPVKDAIFVYSSGKFSQEWNTPTSYNKTAINHISGTAIGNFNATTLLVAQMQNRTTAGLTAPFVLYTAPSTYHSTTTRGTFGINTTVVDEANEWYSHMPAATSHPATSSAPVPGVRYIYNVADSKLPTYSEAKMMIGFDNQVTRDQEHPVQRRRLLHHHLLRVRPLEPGEHLAPATSDLAGATCREFPGTFYPGYGHSKSWTYNNNIPLT